MDIYFWLYVSKSTISEMETECVVETIVSASQKRNAALHISGALTYSDRHFGQIVEGPAAGIMALRSSILSDTRHTEITTIADGKAPRRRFGGWALAHSGGSVVISRALQRALRDAAQRTEGAGDTLLDLLEDTLTVP